MSFSVSPHVTVTELDKSSVIPVTSTSSAAFVGRFDWGPMDKIVLISSEKQLTEVFGPPSSNERGTDWWVVANFLQYANGVYVVRVDESRDVNTSTDGAAGSASPAYSGATAARILTGATSAAVRIRSAGSKGNSLQWISWNYNQSEPLTPSGDKVFSLHPTSTDPVFDSVQAGVLSAGIAGSTLDEVHIALIDRKGLFGASGSVLEKWEGLSRWKGVKDRTGKSLYYKDVINSQSALIEIEQSGTRSIWGNGTTGDPEWSPTQTTSIKEHGVDGATSPHGPFGIDGIRGISFGMSTANFLYKSGKSGSTAAAGSSAASWKFSGGLDSGVTWPYEYDSVDSNSASSLSNPNVFSIKEAWTKHFSNAEQIDINILIAGGAGELIAKHIADLADSRKDCVAFVSPPASTVRTGTHTDPAQDMTFSGYSGPSDVISWRQNNLNVNSSYVVIDSGWKMIYDSYNDKNRWIPLNSDVAGLAVETENSQGSWFSPAGFNRGRLRNVIKLSMNPNKAERDELYSNGINPVVSFPGEGTVLFGDKTAQRRATALDRINVRRLMIHIEKAISTQAKFNLFEFNDDFTQRSFVQSVTPFLRTIQAQRGITDFLVVCDGSNNTADVVDKNAFVADIFIKPAKSINFINLNFSVLRSDAAFSESVV
jgi:hypothetical protein